ncbi:MAG TPA: methylated-DNA--[protein]-cysteine S-methyltransferase [Gemmatimonadaceae bacterium]|nr:methylated-DNA--[protein]-cysteine S-methyltransferase [Gemmatimonadaceae bacterium]
MTTVTAMEAPTRAPVVDDLQVAAAECSLGLVLVAASARGLCAVLLGDDREELRRDLQRRFAGAALSEGSAELRALAARVVELIEQPTRAMALPLDARGTAFQRAVWDALREIPPGATTTYGEIATRLGMPDAARAVAQACAANPLAVVVPCHRVVRRDGGLSGYRWGVERKRALLEREGAARA